MTLVSPISNYFLRKLIIGGDDSEGKMLALKVCDPEIEPQHHLKMLGMEAQVSHPSAWVATTDGSLGLTG